MTKNQIAMIDRAAEFFSHEDLLNGDMPEGTIITEPYYSDTIVVVMRKAETR